MLLVLRNSETTHTPELRHKGPILDLLDPYERGHLGNALARLLERWPLSELVLARLAWSQQNYFKGDNTAFHREVRADGEPKLLLPRLVLEASLPHSIR